MKIKRIVIALASLFAIAPLICGQTTSNYVAQGRAYLAATNLIAANLSFSNALALTPNDPTANAFYAATRLLVLPYQVVGSNFLDRLGVTNSGRSIYHWTAGLPVDTNGVPLAPTGVNADEFTSILRTNVLGEIISAELNLAAVSDTNFTIDLTSQETTTVAVTVDYGDIQLLRATLDAAECFIYETYTWNLDVQLTAVRAFYTNDSFSMGDLMASYAGLLDYDTTNDLVNAEKAFTNAVGEYMIASDFIRSRPTDEVRLFNLAPYKATKEMNFRSTLADLENSLNGAVPLSVNSRYTVFLAPQFSGANPIRSFLPQFHGDGFVVGTLPDPTFAGLYTGLSDAQVEVFFARYFSPIPQLLSPTVFDSELGFLIRGLGGRGYVIQVSTNLTTWTDDAAFVALGGSYNFNDSDAVLFPQRFYRVVDRTASMPTPPNDDFANSIELSGWGTVTTGYNVNATVENNEPGDGEFATVWWSWTAPSSGTAIVGTDGSTFYPYVEVYTGYSLANLNFVSYGNQPFAVVGGTTYQIQVGTFGSTGGIELAITAPPVLTLSTPPGDIVSLSPTNILIQASATDPYGTVTNIQIYANGTYLANTTNTSISYNWTNVGPGVYYVDVQAADNFGITSDSFFQVTVRPPNDDFANRIPIIGDPATVTGSNEGASSEPGEPNHNGDAGGVSVWWTWTAPSNGPVTMTANLVSTYGYPLTPILAVYTGTVLSILTPVVSAQGDGIMEPAQLAFNAVAGTSYQIAVDDVYGEEGNITLSVVPGLPPSVAITFPTNGATFQAPVNITIAANASDPAGTITQVAFYDYEYYPPVLLRIVTNSSYSIIWSNVPIGNYTLEAVVTDNRDVTVYANTVGVNVIPPPPLTVSTAALPNATNGVAYSVQLTAVSGQPPYTWSIISGSLPASLTLAQNGLISGTSSAIGTSDFIVRVTDSTSTTATQPFTLNVFEPLTVLHSFHVVTNGEIIAPPFDGASPAGLVQGTDGYFYGTTSAGGTNGGNGTVFKISTSGSLVTLYAFTGGVDGALPYAPLTLGTDGYFYGTTYSAGAYNAGTVFKISSDGALTTLHAFAGVDNGGSPGAALVQGNDGYFYGTTPSYAGGGVFKIDTNEGFTLLYAFANGGGPAPEAGLVKGSDGFLYGTTSSDGTNDAGTIFKISTDGALTTLYSFNGNNGHPQTGLTLGSDGYLYGTTFPFYSYGTIFKVSTNGAFRQLYSFSGSDGAEPSELFQTSDGDFYGTTSYGGPTGGGTAFKMSTNGTLTTLYSFAGINGYAVDPSELTLGADGNFYGTTSGGNGTVFQMGLDGTLTNLHVFTGSTDGGEPNDLVQASSETFYGTAWEYGNFGSGAVFMIATNGSVANLYSFSGGDDGGAPDAGLTIGNDGNYYGTTWSGGTGRWGTVFRISDTGSLSTLYSFGGTNDGGSPNTPLVQGDDNNFYGTTYYGGVFGPANGTGAYGYGTVFRITMDGVLTSLHGFTGGFDGGVPMGQLVQASDGNFYGTTSYGGVANGTSAHGTAFRITADGALTTLHSFTGGNDGGSPLGPIVQAGDGYVYGTTSYGGGGYGTVFRLNTNGTLTTFYIFTGGNNGASPNFLMLGSDGNFYGATAGGNGGVFKMSSSGVLTTLYEFSGTEAGTGPNSLVQSSTGFLYGTTLRGGQGGGGTVFRLPLPLGVGFAATPTVGIAPLAVQFTSPGTDNGGSTINSWNWTFGDGATSTTQNPSHTYLNPGTFSPTLVATNNNGQTIAGNGPTITVFSPAMQYVVTPTNGIAPLTVQFNSPPTDSGGSTISHWNWAFGDGATSTAQNPTHTYFTVGNFSPTLIATNNIGDTVTGSGPSITVFAPTIQYAATPSNGAAPLAVQFSSPGVDSGGTGIGSWNWTFGDGGISTLQNPSHTYTNATIYSPTLVVINSNGFQISATGPRIAVSPAGVSFTGLYSFEFSTNGAHPSAPLVQGSDGNLYGTTEEGGTNGNFGTVFKISPTGVCTLLHSFAAGADGAYPLAGLVEGADGNLYGTASGYYYGTVFKITHDGAFTTLYSFTGGTNGVAPEAGLIQGADGNFYGTTSGGGNYEGTIFKISPGGAFTNLHSFSGGYDGGDPQAGLVQGTDGNFYGTTWYGGTNRFGTVFRISPSGTFTSLYSFTNGSDGANPFANLIQASDGNFYGTTSYGGSYYYGGVFKVTTNGALTSLYNFTNGADGWTPLAGLLQASDGNFYGTAWEGGAGNAGTVFQISPSGVFGLVYYFSGVDGANPRASLIQSSDGDLYGTTSDGGIGGNGVVFRLTLGPIIEFTANPISGTAPLTVSFASSGNDSTGRAIRSWNWSFGDGSTSTNVNPSHTYATPGAYFPSLIATNNLGTAVSGHGPSISVTAPTVTFTADPTNGLAPLTVNFTTSNVDSSGHSIIGWHWAFGDGSISIAMNPSHTYATPGIFFPALIATNNLGISISGYGPPVTVTTPTVTFTASPTNGLAPLTVNFTAASFDSGGNSIVGWFWTFGDGSTSTNQSPSHIYGSLGTFFPGLVATNALDDIVTGYGPTLIEVTNGPFNSGIVLNGGFETGDFTGWTLSGPDTNDIVIDDGSTTGISPHSGNYLAGLGSSGALGYLSQTLTTTPGSNYLLSLWLNSPDGQIPNEFLVSWNGNTLFDESSIPATGWTNLQFTVSASGSSTVLEFGARNDNSYFGLDDVSVVPSGPTVQFTAIPTSGLVPLTVNFTAASVDSGGNSITGWHWTFGDGSTSTNQNPSHIYESSGAFFPGLVAVNNLSDIVMGSGPPEIEVTNAPFNSGLVLNGGFETGDFTGWTLSGPDTNDIVIDDGSITGISPYSGNYLAGLGSSGALSYLSQTLTTTPGSNYLLSLWLNSPDGQTPNEFLVSWNGNTLFDESSIPAIGWTNLQLTVSASGSSTVLEFGARNDNSYFGLDDVSVILK